MKPAHFFFLGAAIASVVGAASGAGIFLALKAEPQTADKKPAAPVEVAAPVADPCDKQAWPHFDRACLEHRAQSAARAPRNVGTDNPVKPETAALTEQPAAPAAPAAVTPSPVQAAVAPPPAPEPAVKPVETTATAPVAEPQPAKRSEPATAAPVEPPPPVKRIETTGAAPAATPQPRVQPAVTREGAPVQAEQPPAQERATTTSKRKERIERAERRDGNERTERTERTERRETRKPRQQEQREARGEDSALKEVEAELDAMARRGELKGQAPRDERRGERRRHDGEGRGPIVRRWIETVADDDDDDAPASRSRGFTRSESRADFDRGWPFSR